MTVLWHGERPIGICVFTTPARALRLRSRYFGLGIAACRLRIKDASANPPYEIRNPQSGRHDKTARSLRLKRLNQQLWLLARVVLHPTYRGAGVAAAFVRRSCASCPVPWIETLSAMGHINPFFEKAGFARVGVIRKPGRRGGRDHAQLYGSCRLTDETVRKSRFAEPVYYVFDNCFPPSPPK